jgi:hypothetical protein
METKDDEKRANEKQVPIIDGDARPDLNVHGEESEKPKDHPIETPRDRRKNPTTKNRKDTNSLEDYKDGRMD